MATRALTQIFKPTSPFLAARAMDILFDGVGIDCSSEEFEAVSFCSVMSNQKAIKVVNATYLLFSILGGVSCVIIKNIANPKGL